MDANTQQQLMGVIEKFETARQQAFAQKKISDRAMVEWTAALGRIQEAEEEIKELLKGSESAVLIGNRLYRVSGAGVGLAVDVMEITEGIERLKAVAGALKVEVI